MNKIVLWGAGLEALPTLEYCRSIGMEIEACIDIDVNKQGGKLDDLRIIAPEQLLQKDEFYTIIISSLVHEDSIVKTINNMGIQCKYILKTQLMPSASYSQFGEDMLIANVLKLYEMKEISYVEIGIPQGTIGSNTRYFYNQGMRGICIEANPDKYEELCTNRKGDIILNVGACGKKNSGTQMEYFFFKEAEAINTFNYNAMKRWIRQGFQLDKKKNIYCYDLNTILKNNCKECPDYISIDIEGMELEVLMDFDFYTWPVKIWCIEKRNEKEISNIMKINGYVLIAETPSNWIYSLEMYYTKYIVNWAENMMGEKH